MKLFYQNSEGQRVDFTKEPFLIQNPEDLFSYEWKYETSKNYLSTGNIVKFNKNVQARSINIQIWTNSKREYTEALDFLNRIFEVDILTMTPGRLYFNECYLTCYIFAGKYSNYEEDFYTTDKKIDIVTDVPFWIKESEFVFEAGEQSFVNGKKYNYRYPYRYSLNAGENYIENTHYTECAFKLKIYGPCINPYIIIGENRYQVWTVLTSGEWLEIDSIHKKIYKVMSNGVRDNLFNERDKQSSVFKKISPGKQRVLSPGAFDFQIILYEERSEPRWI